MAWGVVLVAGCLHRGPPAPTGAVRSRALSYDFDHDRLVVTLTRDTGEQETVPYDGVVVVVFDDRDLPWKREARVEVADGKLVEPTSMLAAPTRGRMFLKVYGAEPSASVKASSKRWIAAHLIGSALRSAGVDPPAGTPLADSWSFWFRPRRLRIDLHSVAIPDEEADIPGGRPDVYVNLSTGGRSLACTPTLHDRGPGVLDLEDTRVVADFRRVDGFRVGIADRDVRFDDNVRSYTQFTGMPGSTAPDWLSWTVGSSDDDPGAPWFCHEDQGALELPFPGALSDRDLEKCMSYGFHRFPKEDGPVPDADTALAILDAQLLARGLAPVSQDADRASEVLELVTTRGELASVVECLDPQGKR